MSKITDFLQLGPYSHKNSIRTRIGTTIGQIEGKRAQTTVSHALTCRLCTDHTRGSAPVVGRTHGCFCAVAGREVQFGSGFAGDTCRRLIGAALLQSTIDVCSAPATPPFATRRPTQSVTQNHIFDYHIF